VLIPTAAVVALFVRVDDKDGLWRWRRLGDVPGLRNACPVAALTNAEFRCQLGEDITIESGYDVLHGPVIETAYAPSSWIISA
jgi:hypothetical protein